MSGGERNERTQARIVDEALHGRAQKFAGGQVHRRETHLHVSKGNGRCKSAQGGADKRHFFFTIDES